MDPNFSNSPGLALPTPESEHPEVSRGNAQPVVTATAAPMGPATPQPSATAQTPLTSDNQNQSVAAAGATDDDADAIDKEWISKAKAIVEKTRNDPYVESNELGRVKADYLKTRYNKHIKVVE